VRCAYPLLLFLALNLAAPLARSAEEGKPVVVTMKSLSYDPKRVEIHIGDSVIWTNGARTVHTAVSDDEGTTFDTGEIEPGKSSRPIKFERVGDIPYHCKVHGKTMTGIIAVR